MAGKRERESDQASEDRKQSAPTERQLEFGRMVTARIDELGLARKEVAEISEINASTIREMERPRTGRKFGHTVLAAVSEALKWPSDYLFNAYYPPPPGIPSPVAQEMMTALGPYLEKINAIPELQKDVAAIKDRLSNIDPIHPVE